MFLERIGKFCFGVLNPLYFYFISLAPIFFALVYLLIQKGNLDDKEERFSFACKKGKLALERKSKKERFLNRYRNADPYFIDREIESLAFLEQEKEELSALLKHPALADKRQADSRLQFLSSEENRLAFAEEGIRTSTRMKETEEKQRHPVQMDEGDLKKLLALLEDLPIEGLSSLENRPQIIVTDFLLEKKDTSLNSTVLEVDMKLLKREWIR
jgi:hypothetical protein